MKGNGNKTSYGNVTYNDDVTMETCAETKTEEEAKLLLSVNEMWVHAAGRRQDHGPQSVVMTTEFQTRRPLIL